MTAHELPGKLVYTIPSTCSFKN